MKVVDSKKQLKDFEERKDSDSSNVYSFKGYEYITVHPMSDEMELLAELGMQPTDCKKVDLYWKVKNQVFFLQVNSSEFVDNGRMGLFARWGLKNSRVYLEANLEIPYISKHIVEKVMDGFLRKQILTANFSEDVSFQKNTYLGAAPSFL